jgi:uncharacterized protein HemX
MIKWLKSIGTALAAAAIAFVAFRAAQQVGGHKQQARKWQDKANQLAIEDRDDALDQANAALSQAKLEDARAEEAKATGLAKLDKLGAKDESVADIVDSWRKPE